MIDFRFSGVGRGSGIRCEDLSRPVFASLRVEAVACGFGVDRIVDVLPEDFDDSDDSFLPGLGLTHWQKRS